MAYAIFNTADNQLVNIAENDSDKNSLNCLQGDTTNLVTKTITQAQFDKIKYFKTSVELSNGEPSFTDEDNFPQTQEQLQSVIDNFLHQFRAFEKNNSSNAMYSALQTYANILEGLDASSFTFPMTKDLNKYLEEDADPTVSSTFSALQIP